MRPRATNKRKIINDPVYGFISVTNEILFDIIEHPYFQRLRRIKQLGLTHLIYPGALHTRFHHSLGTMFLMDKAIGELRAKGQIITEEEEFGALAAILLHDIGHGPFSHALEHSIGKGINHEGISKLFMTYFNRLHHNKLDTAVAIFNNQYDKKFLHKLVSSQLDMDRIDYLKRDSFFTGVSEGTINYERLINMLDVVNDDLVIHAKGIYSAEKFITARRLMYWQVYLHKTVLVAEYMLMRVLKRAKELAHSGRELFCTPALEFFLKNDIDKKIFQSNEEAFRNFGILDDFDVLTSIKVWTNHKDKVLSSLSKSIINRRFFRIEMKKEMFGDEYLAAIRDKTKKKYKLTDSETDYFVFTDKTSNYAYRQGVDKINILYKDGTVHDISEISDDLNISLLSKPVTKYFLCYPKDIH
ncbi:MAG: phosphohydrolase [Bacteroidetes bacterium]|nr:MAG: phosphohydrolase [Bacteroidota bacterium]RLD47458.1 MAG: phosphohydrolase [Bacteroidota bacterium]